MTTFITPDQIVRTAKNIRMPAFEELIGLYVHHNSRIHEVINKLTPGFQTSFRISSSLLEELRGMGYIGWDLVSHARTFADSEEDVMFVGDVVIFVPPQAGTSEKQDYFVISHPFDTSVIQEKVLERGAQTAYIGSTFETRLVKTLCLTHPVEGYILVSLHGNSQVDWRKLAEVFGFSRGQREKVKQYGGSLEEALGMAQGKVTPLVVADKLPNLAAVVIDAGLEKVAEGSGRVAYLELPFNIDGALITRHNPVIFDQWREDIRHWNDLTGKRETGLAYNPKTHSLADALRTCYGVESVRVADITR